MKQQNAAPPSVTDERRTLTPPSPPSDVSNRRTDFGRIATPDRTAGAFVTPPVDVPGASGTPATPTVSDTRAVSNAGTGRPIGPQPTRPPVRGCDLPYGVTTLGPRRDDGSTR
jgi:hypothetical protein